MPSSALERLAFGGADDIDWGDVDEVGAHLGTRTSELSHESAAVATRRDAARQRRSASTSASNGLPYDESDVLVLIRSLRRWTIETGTASEDSGQAKTDAEWLRSLTTGTTLCRVAERISGRAIAGVFMRPKTTGTMEANVRRGIERLREMRGMSSRFLIREQWTAEDVLGALEDARALVDGLPPRPKKGWVSTRPYAPDVVGYEAPSFERRERDTCENIEEQAPRRKPWDERAYTLSARLKTTKTVGADTESSQLKSSKARRRHAFASRQTNDAPPPSPQEVEATASADPAEALELAQWFARVDSWPEESPHESVAVERILTRMKLGVILCDVVERFTRRRLAGVNRDPVPDGGAAQNNIRLALRALREDPNLARASPALLESERDIAHGDCLACFEIARALKRRFASQ